MVVAVISDVHGNLPALRAVLDEVRRENVEEVLCCGDLASGPLPVETLEVLRSLDLPFRSVRGNADRCAVEAFDGVADPEAHEDDVWTGTQLTQDLRDYLAELPSTLRVDIDGLGSVLLCHGTPRQDGEILLEDTPSQAVSEAMADVHADVVLCGNTHMQFDRIVDTVRIANVGSVGWPYGEPGGYWALLDSGLELRRTQYDLEVAAKELRRRSSWPRIEAFLSYLPNPPTRDEAHAFFEKARRDAR